MGRIKSRRMVGGTTTPRLPPAAPRASRRAPLVNIENIGGESMGEEAGAADPSIRLMYEGDTGAPAAAPGHLGAPAALSGLVAPEHFSPPTAFPQGTGSLYQPLQPSPRLAGRARGNNPLVASPAGAAPFVPRALFAPSPAGTPGMPFRGVPASPAEVASFGPPRTLFHPPPPGGMEEEEEEMEGGRRKRKMTKRHATGRKMVGGTTTPIIPPFVSPIAAATSPPPPPPSPPPPPAFSPPRALRAAPPAAAYAAPYSHGAIRRGLAPETPAPGQSWEDLQNERVAQELQRQAMPVFGAPPPSPAVPASAFAAPLNARRVPVARSAYAALSPSANNGSPLRTGALFEEGEMEGGARRRRGTKKRRAIRGRFHGQRGGWPWSCTGSKCTAAVAPAPLSSEQMNYIQYKPGGVGRGWRCPLCKVISPVLEYTDRYVRGSRANNEDGYYAHTCPACQQEIPGMEENIRIQEGQAAVQRLVSEEQVASATDNLRRTAREIRGVAQTRGLDIEGTSEENINKFLRNNKVGGARRRGTKKRGTKRKAIRRTLHRLRGGWPSWLTNPFSSCMGGKCTAAVAPAQTPTAEDAEIAEIRRRVAAAAAEESAAAQRGMEEFRAKMALEAEVEAQVRKFGEEGAGEYGALILSLNNTIYNNIQRLIQMNETRSIQVYRTIQLNLLSLLKVINNLYVACKTNENNDILKRFLMKRTNMQSNMRFILQLLALYQENRAISTDVEPYLHDNENVMLILEEMREAVKMVCLRPVVVSGEKISLIQYVKTMSADTQLTRNIQTAIGQLMYVMTFMRPQPREAWGAVDE